MRPLLTVGFARTLAVAAATGWAHSASAVELPGPVPVLPGTVARTVEVHPGTAEGLEPVNMSQ